MKNNPLIEKIIQQANMYEQVTGTKPHTINLHSGQYFLYWSSYSDELLAIVDMIEEARNLGFSRNLS